MRHYWSMLSIEDKIVPYVNGGCLPRVTCVPVHAQQVTTGGIVFPNCVEVHRCSGCCQETQFSCEPTKIEQILFSPVRVHIFVLFDSRSMRYVRFRSLNLNMPKKRPLLLPHYNHSRQKITLNAHVNVNWAKTPVQVRHKYVLTRIFLEKSSMNIARFSIVSCAVAVNKPVFLNVKQCNVVNCFTMKTSRRACVNGRFPVKMVHIHVKQAISRMLVASSLSMIIVYRWRLIYCCCFRKCAKYPWWMNNSRYFFSNYFVRWDARENDNERNKSLCIVKQQQQ
jgi:hypothetical protein